MNFGRILRALVGLAVLSALGCQTVIGTKDRTLDPALSDGGTDSPACTQYCQAIMTHCMGENQQYTSSEACLSACKYMDPGPEGTDFGNNLQCRQHWATTLEPEVDCKYAGPAGSDQCGSTCDSYCTLITRICTDTFDSYAQCISDCQKMPDLGTFDVRDQHGDTRQCRIYHTIAATKSKSHCKHSGATPTEYCVASDDGTPDTASCVPDQGADACERCEDANCCPEVSGCYNDVICHTADDDLDQCVDEGGGDECQAVFVATNDLAAAIHLCKSQKCAAECGLPPTSQ